MILDPDMILLRPLTYDFTESNVIIHESDRGTDMRFVEHGRPWASLYGFGDGPFRSVDVRKVFIDHPDSPALTTSKEEQRHNYPGGPPYMATGRDMLVMIDNGGVRIAMRWTNELESSHGACVVVTTSLNQRL